MSLPPMHRPTREDFLSLTTNVWQRLRVNFKWFTIKSFRKYDADEVSALFTWFLMSQTLWILIGTWVFFYSTCRNLNSICFSTTFFGAIFATLNSLRLQGESIFIGQVLSVTSTSRARCSYNQRLLNIRSRHNNRFRVCSCPQMERLQTLLQKRVHLSCTTKRIEASPHRQP